jgi:hypothetical protein
MTIIPMTSAPSQLNSTHDDGQRGSAAQQARWLQIKKKNKPARRFWRMLYF